MIQENRNSENSRDQQVHARRDWVAPEVKRISAGSAEDAANILPDGGVPS